MALAGVTEVVQYVMLSFQIEKLLLYLRGKIGRGLGIWGKLIGV